MSDSATPVGLAVPTRKPASSTAPGDQEDTTHTPSQRYLSTRGGSYGVSRPIEPSHKHLYLSISSFLLKKLF